MLNAVAVAPATVVTLPCVGTAPAMRPSMAAIVGSAWFAASAAALPLAATIWNRLMVLTPPPATGYEKFPFMADGVRIVRVRVMLDGCCWTSVLKKKNALPCPSTTPGITIGPPSLPPH